jgi:flagellar basal-body rod protein FlgC
MVDNITGTALSGLRASSTRIAVAADNIANARTQGFDAREVKQVSQASGVSTEVTQTDSPVSFDKQLADAVIASYDFKANLKVLQAQARLDRKLFDIQA